jgi:hypothetical protein
MKRHKNLQTMTISTSKPMILIRVKFIKRQASMMIVFKEMRSTDLKRDLQKKNNVEKSR